VSGGSRRHHVVRSPVAAVPLPHSLTHTHTHTLTRGIHHPQKDEIFWVHHSGLLLFFLIVGYPSSDYHHCSTGRQTSRTRCVSPSRHPCPYRTYTYTYTYIHIYMLHGCTCTCTCVCTCTCLWFSTF
jgi:hypothetical protein